MKTFKLASGDEIPAIGLGTWKMEPNVAKQAVRSAIDIGFRHIDCASIYGNEAAIGESLADAFDSGKVQRDELWVTSKLWNDAHQPERVRVALIQTLEDLQLEFLDLYLMHWPVAHRPGVLRPDAPDDYLTLDQVPLEETFLAMEECRLEGLCRNIGVSNFSPKKIEYLIADTSLAPAVNQVELHPYLQQPKLLEVCRQNDVLVTAYSPLGSPDRPEEMKRKDEPTLFSDPELKELASERGVGVGELLLAWAIQRGTVAIPKAASPGHQRDNLAAAEIVLTEEQMGRIAALDRHYRFVTGDFWEMPGGPYTVADLWNE